MREEADFIEITDFSPGIFSDNHFGGPVPGASQGGTKINMANGAATIENTYRCCADMTGALVPLPKLVAGKTSGVLPTASNASDRYMTGHHASYLLDGMVRGDFYVEDSLNPATADRPSVYTMYGMAYKVTGDPNFQWTVIARNDRLYQSSSAKLDIMWARCTGILDSLNPLQLGAGNFIPFRPRIALRQPAQDAVAWVAYGSPGYEGIDGGSPFKSGTIPAGELSLTDYDTENTGYPGGGTLQREIGLFADFQLQTSMRSRFLNTVEGNPVFIAASHLVAHQGRIVAICRVANFAGRVSSLRHSVIGEAVEYSPVQDYLGTLGFTCFERTQFAEEKPVRTGVTASITADEIIFIRDRGGAVILRGDMDNPTVIQLPYVESTHGARSIPAHTPIGLVYGTRNGVYLWEGGETTKELSRQIEGWFWNHDAALTYLGNRGRFGWWNPWVCVPNNYLLDTRTEAWWRLDTAAATGVALNAYDVSNESDTLYAFPHKLHASNDVMWYTAKPDVLARSYSWQSQPIIESRARMMTVQEVHLVASPGSTTAATVTITLTGINNEGIAISPVNVVFTLGTNKNPQQHHKDVVVNFQATHIRVRVQADSNSDSAPAPKIHSLSLATADRARVRKS